MKFSITSQHEFSYAHYLANHPGKCKYIHGHNARVEFTVYAARLDENGMVCDFAIIKNTLGKWIDENWDHKLLIFIDDAKDNDILHNPGVVALNFQPTAENLACYLLTEVGPRVLIKTDLDLIKVDFYETDKYKATVETL